MFVHSNDLFYAPADNGMALWDAGGFLKTGDVTSEFMLWDAGTEMNEEPGEGIAGKWSKVLIKTESLPSARTVWQCCQPP